MAALRKIPLELREKIYGPVLELDDEEPLPFCSVITQLKDMGAFERALIPERDLYLEFLTFRIKNSVLRIRPKTITTGLFSEFKYDSTELMCPMARDSIRAVNVEIPGSAGLAGEWTHAKLKLRDTKGYPYKFKDRKFKTRMIPDFIFEVRNAKTFFLDPTR
ncbi:hypothetical protein SBOR_2665 [Sclerotinia borealis F-4128]|uniref:Uncharacterized protein n=1 Tax=Sclerotinia borealis (strain F-4128) TaxID=1432307 RepID=W9CMA0_SCLBF|nr:hypothetical protein SBOR_2665 [Sclerotinia borealis F-4128]